MFWKGYKKEPHIYISLCFLPLYRQLDDLDSLTHQVQVYLYLYL